MRRPGLWIFVLAFGFRATYIFATASYLDVESAELVRVARALATQGTYADPFGPTGPTAHVSPLYPVLLSGVYRLAGSSPQLWQELFAIALTSAGLALLPLVSVAGGMGQASGVLAGAIGAILPLRLWVETKGAWEAPLNALLVILLVLASLRAWPWPWRGTVTGLVLLSSPSASLVAVSRLALELLTPARRQAILTGTMALVILAPWVVRNAVVFKAFIPFRSNLGLELAVANSATAVLTHADLLRAGSKARHPSSNRDERARVESLGEVAYNAERMREARSWIAAHPVTFAKTTLRRVGLFWFTPVSEPWKAWSYGFLTCLGAAGWFVLYRRQVPMVAHIIPLWLGFPLIYYFLHADTRYSYPLHWTILLGAASLFTNRAGSLSSSGRSST